MSEKKNNRQGGGKHPNSPRYSDRYGKGHINPYLGGQPKHDTLLREIEERQNAVRRENELEAARIAEELEAIRRAEEAIQTNAEQPAAEENSAGDAEARQPARSNVRRINRDGIVLPKVMDDPAMQERLDQIRKQAIEEARALRGEEQSDMDGFVDFDDEDDIPDVKLRLSEDNKPLIALETRGSDGHVEVRWIPVVLSDEEMEKFFPAIDPVQVSRETEPTDNETADEPESAEGIPDEDGLVLIPIAGMEEEPSEPETEEGASAAVIEPLEEMPETDTADVLTGQQLIDALPVIEVGEVPEDEPEDEPDESGEEEEAGTDDAEDSDSDGSEDTEEADDSEQDDEQPVQEDEDSGDDAEPEQDSEEESASEAEEEPEQEDEQAENESEQQDEPEDDSSDDEPAPDDDAEEEDEAEQEAIHERIRRTAIASRPVYDELETNNRYAQSRYSEEESDQDDSLFLRKSRPETMALFPLADGERLPQYINDDDFVERWLGNEEEEDMASDSKRRRRRISTLIGAVTMVLALIGFIAVARWGIGMLSGIGNTDSQKSEYADFISPVVMSEVPVFEAWDAIPQDKLLQSAVFRVLLEMNVSYERDDTGKFIIPSTDIVNAVKELYGASSDDPSEDDAINTQIRNALYGSAGEDTTNTDVYYVYMEDSFHVADGLSGPAPEVIDISRRDDTVTLTVQYLEDLEGGSGGLLYSRQFILTLNEEGYYVQAIREAAE